MRVVIVGDSHTGALQRGKEQLKSEGGWPNEIELTVTPLGNGNFMQTPFFADRGSHVEIVDNKYRRQIEQIPLPERGGKTTLYGFCAPLHTRRVWRSPAWANYAPFSLCQDEIPISAAMLTQIIMDDLRYGLEFMDVILRAGKQLFVVEAPYPFRHDGVLQRTRPEIIHEINKVYRRIANQELEKRSIPVVSLPDGCVDGDGFMDVKYRHERENDGHHGNLEYGRAMMLRILEFVSSK